MIGEPHGGTRSRRSRTQQDLLRVDAPSINKETRLCAQLCVDSAAHPRTHLEEAKFKYPNDFSSMCPTHMRNPSIFSVTLICLCINIGGGGELRLEGSGGEVSGGLTPRLSSLFPSGVDFGKLSAAPTVNLPARCHAAILQGKQSVSLSTGHLRYFQR